MEGRDGWTRMNMNPREFRNVLGRFVTGITVVTTVHGGEVYGMTANSFCSVSVDPPLVSIAADHGTVWHERVSRSRLYGVSVLSSEQGDLSNRFAGRRPEADPSEVYWLPLSEWCTSPAAGRRLWIAMFSASRTNSVRRWFAIDQPTTFLE